MKKVEIGQFWVDNSKDNRVVQVLAIRGDLVRVKTIVKGNDLVSSGYGTWVLARRFNLRRNGFTLLPELRSKLL